MSPWVIVAIVIAFDAIFVPLLIVGLIRGSWKPLEDKYPQQPAEADALRREFQSIRIDMFNLSMCVHLAVDSKHLHIEPAWIVRKAGARTMSIPWSAMKDHSQRRKFAKVKLGFTTLTAPAWALELAKSDQDSG